MLNKYGILGENEMRIIDKTLKTNLNHTAINKIRKNTRKVAMTPEEQIKSLVAKGREVLANMVAELVPEKGKLNKSVSISFNVPATNNRTIIAVEESAENKLIHRDLVVGVRHQQRDRLTSNILLMKKPKQEIIDYLKDNMDLKVYCDTDNSIIRVNDCSKRR